MSGSFMPTLLSQPGDKNQNSSHLWLTCVGCFEQEAAAPATKWRPPPNRERAKRSSLLFRSRPVSLVLHADGWTFQTEAPRASQDVLMSLWGWMAPLTGSRLILITWYKAGLFLDSVVCCENLGLQIKHQNSHGCLYSCFMCLQACVF